MQYLVCGPVTSARSAYEMFRIVGELVENGNFHGGESAKCEEAADLAAIREALLSRVKSQGIGIT